MEDFIAVLLALVCFFLIADLFYHLARVFGHA